MGTRLLLASLCLLVFVATARAQTTTFTYQGKLTDNGNPAAGVYDFEFRLFDALESGAQKGTTLTLATVEVVNGTFSVQLDFVGCLDCFDGGARFLDISVRPAGAGSYTLLTPRQPITSTPYAIKAQDATRLGGQLATDFIQNTTTEQTMTNFNIGGNGTVGGTLTGGVVNATTQYNIGANRVLSIAGTSNLFAGVGAGAANTTGNGNAFFGAFAGFSNTTGSANAFFGLEAGFNNTTGSGNSFVGAQAGRLNTTGNSNSFVGAGAGLFNTTGFGNSFFGSFAGQNNTTGERNVFVGLQAGQDNTIGGDNAFVGANAGQANTTGVENSFFGRNAGAANTAGIDNSFVGANAGFSNTGGNENSFFGGVCRTRQHGWL